MSDFLSRALFRLDRDLLRPSLLAPYNSLEARRMLAAIAWTESKCAYLYQRTASGLTDGLAVGLFQFEVAGIAGLSSSPAALACLILHDEQLARLIQLPGRDKSVHDFLPYRLNWQVFLARALLATDPRPLPVAKSPIEDVFLYYRRLWRPGRPSFSAFKSGWLAAISVIH